jgi:hypothetical protein
MVLSDLQEKHGPCRRAAIGIEYDERTLPVKTKAILATRLIIGLAALALVVQAYALPRFTGIKVIDSKEEFDPTHIVKKYWDDDLEKYVEFSYSFRDIPESFLMQAAAWEALDEEWDKKDKRKVIFVNASRSACAA